MQHKATSMRPFIGAKDFTISRDFYKDLGFEEFMLGDMSYFKVSENIGFYLQNYYVEHWINNTMLFLEVLNVEDHWQQLTALKLTERYKGVKISSLKYEDWGKEYFVHDPSGVVWHFGSFKK